MKTLTLNLTQTGIDFFPNLVNQVGSAKAASIESTKATW